MAGPLDVWSPASYQGLAGARELDGDDAASAIDRAMTQLVRALDDGGGSTA